MRDGTTKIWDAVSGVNLSTLPVEAHGAYGAAFDPTGNHLGVGGKSGLYVFVLPIDDVIALAKTRVTRSFTIDECKVYLHVNHCPAAP